MTAPLPQSAFVGKGVPPPAPADFRETFIRIGRLACEEYYKAEGLIIDAWLREVGKQSTIDERAKHVAAKEAERHAGRRLNRRDMGRVLEAAFPTGREAHPEIARQAAQHLRIKRNGGVAVSPMMSGGWMVGIRRVTTDELIEMAKARGFGANLPGD